MPFIEEAAERNHVTLVRDGYEMAVSDRLPAVGGQVVTLDTPLTDAMRRGFAAGVTLTDGETMAPAGVEPLTDDGLSVQVTLRQGVYHQIKRMFGVFDAGVNALHRGSIGGVALDPALAPGQWRELTAQEVERLQNVK